MQHRNENSVLTSLKDLKRIEEDRKQREEDRQREREAAEQQARLDAERLAREQEERQRMAAEEAARAEVEAQHREEREASLRVAEAEAAARVEAEARLEAERMRMEVEQGGVRGHRWAVPVFLAVLLAAGGALGYVFGVMLPAREKAQAEAERARMASLEAKAKQERKALLARLDKQERKLQAAIAKAKSDREVVALKKQLLALKQQAADARKPTKRVRRTRVVRRTPKRTQQKPPMKPDPSLRNNALRGLFEDK